MFGEASSVLAETVAYNPSACSDDAEEMVYVTLYGQVLRFPYDQPLYIGAMPPERREGVLPAQKPDDPEGCPGHPLVGQTFSFNYLYENLNSGAQSRPIWRADRLQIIAVHPHFAGMQISREEEHRRRCSTPGERRLLANGLQMCSVRPNEPDRVPEWGASYKANPEVYGAPFGRPFVVQCYPGVFAGDGRCTAGYKLLDVVNITYDFVRTSIPIDSIIEFDKLMRARLLEAHVPKLSVPYTGNDTDHDQKSIFYFLYPAEK